MRRVAGGEHHLDDQQSGTRLHGPAAIPQDGQALVLIPVMNNVREDIRVATGGNALEEIASLDRDSTGKTVRLNERGCFPNDVRLIKQDTTGADVALENFDQQIAGAAANVNYGLELGEVVGGCDRWRLVAMEA